MFYLADRVHRKPRIWSNKVLLSLTKDLGGDIVNVSAYLDEDKQGRKYQEYFPNASSYTITNFTSASRGITNQPGEIFLDLEADLPRDMHSRFDVVFNHTTLEHIFDVTQAFENLCLMSKNMIVVVVPFLQQYHADYGDYWRFTPTCLIKLASKNGFTTKFITWNDNFSASTYIVMAAVRDSNKSAIFDAHPLNKINLISKLSESGGPGYKALGVFAYVIKKIIR